MSALQIAKYWLVAHLHLAKDALHIDVALLLFLGSAALFRWPLASRRPWLLVAIVAVAGEAWDLRDSIVYGTPVVLAANVHDLWNTLLWPSVLALLARTRRLRLR